jgi:hypothetical protein
LNIVGGYCPPGSAIPTICPKGSFCIAGIQIPEPCRVGAYGNTTGLTSADQCIICDGGFYCDGYGLTATRGLVSAGFFLSITEELY